MWQRSKAWFKHRKAKIFWWASSKWTKRATSSPQISQENCFILEMIVHGQFKFVVLCPIFHHLIVILVCEIAPNHNFGSYWDSSVDLIHSGNKCLLSVSLYYLFSVCLQCDWCRCRERHPSVHPWHRHVRGWLGHLAAVPQSGPEEAAWGHGPVQRRLWSRGTSGFHLRWHAVSWQCLLLTSILCYLIRKHPLVIQYSRGVDMSQTQIVDNFVSTDVWINESSRQLRSDVHTVRCWLGCVLQ